MCDRLPEFAFRERDIDNFPNIHCSFESYQQFSRRNRQNTGSSLSIMNINIRSMRKNFNLMQIFLSLLCFRFTVIVVTETWLTSDQDHCFEIPGYNRFALYRNNYGGGISVYVDTTVMTTTVDDMTYISDEYELLGLKLRLRDVNVSLFSVYRPPTPNIVPFTEQFTREVLQQTAANSSDFFLW